ncbi:ComF family protein [Parasphingorhabdus sp.]|uniref:ComF family protein n=1 Tax=Parasphingorhabdus sp. TaxID=2709688 RepID=UPI003A8F211B
MSLATVMQSIVDYALPSRCAICGASVETDNRFCLACWQKLDFLARPWCAACGLPFSFERADDSLCGKCLVDRPIHDGVRAVVRYDDSSSLIAMRLKYGTRLGLAKLIAKHLQKFACDFPDNAIIIPVPLHRSRLWTRGFNQSVLIGRELARGTGIEMNYNLISRCKITPPLRGMNSAQRTKIVASAFKLSTEADKQLAGKSVLLVDDVYTSGSTSNACARLLKKAGALNIFVFCWARVIKDLEAS